MGVLGVLFSVILLVAVIVVTYFLVRHLGKQLIDYNAKVQAEYRAKEQMDKKDRTEE